LHPRGISEEIVDKHPEVPWSGIIGMRNVIVHGYFKVDERIAWKVVEENLPSLKKQMKTLLKELPEGT
jgi:uncharacterized protein with HEPN domain